ncbi:MAG: PadR family transcriptional regulator [Chloroflexota bacterium]
MDVKEHLPLPETTFLILLSLARAPRHGYAIMQDVAELSEGRLQMSTGTLYGGLRRMLEQGWIERFDEKSKVVDGRARKAYRLTELGRKILNADVARMQSLLQAVRQGNAV